MIQNYQYNTKFSSYIYYKQICTWMILYILYKKLQCLLYKININITVLRLKYTTICNFDTTKTTFYIRSSKIHVRGRMCTHVMNTVAGHLWRTLEWTVQALMDGVYSTWMTGLILLTWSCQRDVKTWFTENRNNCRNYIGDEEAHEAVVDGSYSS